MMLSMSEPNKEARLREFAVTTIAELVRQQNQSQPFMSDHNEIASPPSGFTVEVNGRTTSTRMSNPMLIAPVDGTAYISQLRRVITQMMRDSIEAKPIGIANIDTPNARKPIPAFTRVRISGPSSIVEFEVPTNHSEKYKSAADAARASGPIVEENLNKVAEEIRRINRGEAK